MSASERIKQFIAESDLLDSEKNLFLKLLSRAGEEELNELAELFESDREWVQKIYRNYEAKRAAIEAGNTDIFEEVVRLEVEALEVIPE